MRICFIVGAFPKMKCGVGDYCSKLAKELVNNENEIYVITSTKAISNIEGVKVFNIVDNWDKSSTKKIITTLKSIKPDVVNIQYPSNEYKDAYYIFNILPLIIKLKIRCKLTETIHEYDLEDLSKKRKVRYYCNFMIMNKIIVVEDFFKDAIKRDFKRAKVEYIQISSNISRVILDENEKYKIRNTLGLKAKHIVSYFGFISESKGIEILLKSISKMNDIQLLILSELNKENEYHNQILNLIKDLNIEDKVKITGFLEDEKDVAKYLSSTDLCVLPFRNGVQKRNGSFLAAYNQFIPIITTSSKKQIDDDGVYYIECNNEEVLQEKMERVLSEKNKISRKELNWERVAKQYMEVWK